MATSVRGVHVVFGLALCLSCSTEQETSPAVYYGEHFSLETNDEVTEVCEGTLAAIDREIVRIDNELGLDSAASANAEIKIVPYEVIDDYCPPLAGGCARDNEVVVSLPSIGALAHELAHQRTRRYPSKFLFREGLAQAVTGNACIPAALDSIPLDTLLESKSLQDVGEPILVYQAGGELFNWLLAVHGPDSVLAFLNEASKDTTAEDVRSLYLERFGTSLDDDIYGHLRKPADLYTRAQTGCVAPEVPSVDGTRRLRASMDCASEDVQNDFSLASLGMQDWGIVEWVIEVEPHESGYFELHGDLPESLRLAVFPCVCEGAHPTDFRHLDPPPVFSHDFLTQGPRVLLGAGDYRIFWSAPLDVGLDVDVELAPVCGFEAQDCPAGEQCTIWNSCEPEAASVAALGESCEQAPGGSLVCEAGSRCVAGVCTAVCDADRACPAGLVCGRSRTCGPSCSLDAQDCSTGWSCVPTVDAELDTQGIGHCQPAGTARALEPCDMVGASCDVGLSCERVDDIELVGSCGAAQLAGCCVPLCDPGAADPGCPSEVPTCMARFVGSPVGVCV